ncbi:MAG: hypothetical protein ABR562_05670 [Thermoplasmatota archaeon]
MARRRHSRGLLLLLFVVAASAIGAWLFERNGLASGSGDAACDESLWAHVYNPERLQDAEPGRHHQCLKVTGTVTSIRREDDGDDHIRVHLDAGFERLLDQRNIDGQHGDLVVEPVCVHEVTQSDAVQSCAAFGSKVTIPKVSDRVEVVGVWILDTQHGWMELHPVTSIRVLA